jgi:hypothetical protein
MAVALASSVLKTFELTLDTYTSGIILVSITLLFVFWHYFREKQKGLAVRQRARLRRVCFCFPVALDKSMELLRREWRRERVAGDRFLRPVVHPHRPVSLVHLL